MKNRKTSRAYEARRRKLSKLMSDPDTFEDKLEGNVTEKDIELMHEIARESRLNDLFDDLNINKTKIKKLQKKVIKLSPKSKKYHLTSHIFSKHKGLYRVGDLLDEYHDDILRTGMLVGIYYGKKFIIKDIQDNRITKQDLMNMNDDELYEYFYEQREEI